MGVVWFYTLASVFLVSALSLVGMISLALTGERLSKVLFLLVGFAVGALFGDAFIHLLPESFERLGGGVLTSLLVILGIFLFFVLEKFIHWRHCHIPVSKQHQHPLVTMNLIGDSIHNLIDGILIAASYMVSIPIGLTTTLAVILHEIPQEIGDFGVLLHGGLSVRKALLYNFFTGLIAVGGALITLILGQNISHMTLLFLPITAGGFIYIAGSDLIPELKHDTRLKTSLGQFVAILCGVAVMALLALWE